MLMKTISNPLVAHPLTNAVTSSNAVQEHEITLAPGEVRQVVLTVDADEAGYVVVQWMAREEEKPGIVRLRSAGVVLGPGGATCIPLQHGISPERSSIYILSRDDDTAVKVRIETRISKAGE